MYACPSVRPSVGNTFGFPICQRLWSPYVKSWRERTPNIFVYYSKVYFLENCIFWKCIFFFENFFLTQSLPSPNFFQTERTRWSACLPSFCELVFMGLPLAASKLTRFWVLCVQSVFSGLGRLGSVWNSVRLHPGHYPHGCCGLLGKFNWQII